MDTTVNSILHFGVKTILHNHSIHILWRGIEWLVPAPQRVYSSISLSRKISSIIPFTFYEKAESSRIYTTINILRDIISIIVITFFCQDKFPQSFASTLYGEAENGLMHIPSNIHIDFSVKTILHKHFMHIIKAGKE